MGKDWDAPRKSYTVELRKDISEPSDEEAQVEAQRLARAVGGYVSAVFTEDWEEL